jgi:hypothetical protein
MTQGLGSVKSDNVLITPLGGTQATMASLLNGGTVAAGGLLVQFSSITPAGSTAATATPIASAVTQLGTGASTTGAAFSVPAASLAGVSPPLLVINSGTAAVHIYALNGDTIDTTAGTTGVTLTNAKACFFTPVASGTWVSGPVGGTSA